MANSEIYTEEEIQQTLPAWTPEVFLAYYIYYRNMARPGAHERAVKDYLDAIFSVKI